MSSAQMPVPKPGDGCLRERARTAILFAPLSIAAVLLLPSSWFAVALGALFLVGAWEWSELAGWRSLGARMAILIAHAAMLFGVFAANDELRMSTIACGVAFWLIAPWWLRHHRFGEQTRRRSRFLKTGASVLAIVPSWTAAVVLHEGERGAAWVLFVLLLVWCADTCAYFVGRRFGITKLAPNISPGKTRAGVYGAMIGSAIYAATVGHFGLDLSPSRLPAFVGLCLVAVGFSIVGDLIESLIKRHSRVKDSGTLFPGHGGALDRLDSMFAALPIFVAGRWLLAL